MDQHDEMYFTMWYGVYHRPSRRLTFASAGHHPVFLVGPERTDALALQSKGPFIGLLPDHAFSSRSVTVAPAAALHLFSDGLFEVVSPEGRERGLADFQPLLLEPPDPGRTEPERLFERVRSLSGPAPFDDDVSILTVTFR